MPKSVRELVEKLERDGELLRITEPTDVRLHIAACADLASKAACPVEPSASAKRNDPRFWDRGGPAMLFEKPLMPDGSVSEIPVLMNAFGSYRRMETVLQTPRGFDALGATIGELAKPQPPRSLAETVEKLKQFAPLLKIPPKTRRGRGPCQQVVRTGDQIDLTKLPIIKCWTHDGDFASLGYPADVNTGIPDVRAQDDDLRGRYITLAGIHTIHADDHDDPKPASHNIGMYRVQLMGEKRLAMHWHVHHDGAAHWRSWKKLGKPMPVAIVLGGEWVLPYAATAPLPPGISELLMAGFLHGRGIELVRGVSVPVRVPANAEIVIEGFVRTDAGTIGWDPRESDEPLGPGAVFEGPFGDHTGFYSMPDRYPIVEVSAVTMREKPIYPTTVVGLPPQEDYFLGKATERLFLPLLQVLIPDIADYDLPMFGAFHNCAFLQIKKAYPMQARRVMHAVWGAGQMAWTKHLFVVDDDVDVHDTAAVLRAASAHCLPGRDIERVLGPVDILDHAAPRLGVGTKLGFDCTRKWMGEEGRTGVPLEVPGDARDGSGRARCAEVVSAVDGVNASSMPDELDGWLFVAVDKHRGGDGRRVLSDLIARLSEDPARPRYIVALGSLVDIADFDAALFHWCANFDAGRDAVWPDDPDGVIGFDATPKNSADVHDGQPVRAWPPVLGIDESTHSAIEPITSRFSK
ncbi:MAG: UbiD family decarboxylase [Planctomycetota bacterium]